jgi:hypothetical protein
MSCLRLCPALALVAGLWLATMTAHGQAADPQNNPADSGHNGTRPLPPIPGESQDLRDRYDSDPSVRSALREKDRLDSLRRQKQLAQATELLLKVAQELRTELAASPDGVRTKSETDRLKLIEKLAHLIQDREKAQDQVSAALAKMEKVP